MFDLMLLELGIGFMTGLSGTTVPGPVFIFVLQQSIARGFKNGLIATIAHAIVGLIILIMILITGVAVIFGSPMFQLYMGLVGGLSLIILGFIILAKPIEEPTLEPEEDAGHPFIGGIIVSISNPAFFLWWAVIGLPMLAQARDLAGMGGIYAWTLGIMMALFLWYGGTAYVASHGRERIPARLFFAVSLICGLFLISMGALFIGKYWFGVI